MTCLCAGKAGFGIEATGSGTGEAQVGHKAIATTAAEHSCGPMIALYFLIACACCPTFCLEDCQFVFPAQSHEGRCFTMSFAAMKATISTLAQLNLPVKSSITYSLTILCRHNTCIRSRHTYRRVSPIVSMLPVHAPADLCIEPHYTPVLQFTTGFTSFWSLIFSVDLFDSSIPLLRP